MRRTHQSGMRRHPLTRVGLAAAVASTLVGCGREESGDLAAQAYPARGLVWQDEFVGAAGAPPDPKTWTAELGAGGWGNEELQSYTGRRENLAQTGRGQLAITARREAFTGADRIAAGWTSARITTLDKKTIGFGTVAVRVKVPKGQGMWAAAWTMGTNIREVGWPACSEHDILESLNDATEAIQTSHGPQPGVRDWSASVRTKSATSYADGWHVFSVTRTKGKVSYAIDGIVTRTVTRKDMPAEAAWTLDTPQYMLLNLAVGGTFPGPPDATSPAQATYLVDWVRVWPAGSRYPTLRAPAATAG